MLKYETFMLILRILRYTKRNKIFNLIHNTMTKIKINKSEVLKNAWKLYKAQSIKTMEMFSQCMKQAWKQAKNPVKTLDLNKIYKDNYNFVCNVIRQKTFNNSNDVDIIANDVFLQVNKVLSIIKVDKDIKPFLYQIAKNKVIDYYRSEKKHSYTTKISDYTDDKGNEYFTLPDTSKVDSIETLELNQKINSTFENLGEQNNKILTMYLIDGLKYREIAEILNIPINSVGVYIARAKEIVKNQLGSDYEAIKAEYL